MKLALDPESSVPIYIQIEDSIHSLIARRANSTRRTTANDQGTGCGHTRQFEYGWPGRILNWTKEGVISTQRGKGDFLYQEFLIKSRLKRNAKNCSTQLCYLPSKKPMDLGYSIKEIKEAYQNELNSWIKEKGNK